MATNNLLTQPTPHYHKFVDNQVLTDDQLNDMLDYLNHQDRLSRMLLHGVGTVCGLQIRFHKNKGEIYLSDGVAVTTAGDLLKPGTMKFKGFRKFTDSNVKYRFFTKSDGSTMDLWELETDTSPSDVKPLSQFESTTDISFEKAVAVLYLEDYLGEEEDCSPVDCDTQGRPVINRLRVLLLSQESAKKIAAKDSIFSGLLHSGSDPLVQELPREYVPRVLLNQGNTQSFDQFKNAYNVSFNTIGRHIMSLASLSIFEELFEEAGVDPSGALQNVQASALNFQYLYDFYHDLVNAYNELREMLMRHYSICCPDPEAFPKHVLLGSVVKDVGPWRHPFYPSPTHMHSAAGNLNRAFRRLLLMIRDFRPDEKNDIRITPSRDDGYSMGKRAVPFYYNLERSVNPDEFLAAWKEENIELVPNYYGRNYPGADFNPLNVHLEDHDFYRIEGHTGKHIIDAHKQISEIRKGKNLPFDIQQVAIGDYPDESTIDYEKYRVYFEDLQVILQAWNEEQQCLMKTASSFLTKFSTQNPGTHLSYVPQQLEANEGGGSGLSINTNLERLSMHHVSQPVTHLNLFGAPSKKSKPKENQVMSHIATDDGSLGLLMNNVVKTTDNRNDIWVKTNNAVADKIRDWDPDIVEATVKIPGQLVGYLKETEDHKLTDIEDFTEENLKKYIESLEAQCRKTGESKKKIESMMTKEASVLRSKEWTESYLDVLNRISSSCCLIEKVKVLYQTILERKRELLDQFVLRNFIEKHPGAEHKAGVEKGGTFILLYYSKSRKEKPAKSIEFNERMVSRMVTAGHAFEPFRSGRTLREFDTMTHFPGSIAEERDFRRLDERDLLEIPDLDLRRRGSIPQRENIPHGTVVGDLCLPYICCSDTPSTNFVFPDQLATLRIPVDHVCVDENGNSEPIALSVTPTRSTVKAFIQNREIANAIVENENGTFFDPARVSTADYGSVIRFEVNGQAVEATLTVHRKPTVRFIVSENIAFKEENTIAVVRFQNRSEPFDELTFKWNFDGEIVENENALEFTHMFKVEPGRNFDFNVSLTAFNGPCQDEFRESVNIDVPELEQPDEPDQPDNPDEPDQPDQPDRNCVQVTTRDLKASFRIMDREARQHQNEIDAEFLSMYQQQIRPLYEQILNNIESALNGQFDNQALPLIQMVQKSVIESIPGQDSVIQREFLLKLYYEMALLYFYLNSCRDGRITRNIAMHDRRNNWLTFTKMAIQEFEEAMQMLFEVDNIPEKLVAVRDRMGSRFDNQMKRLIDQLIQMMKQFIERG